MSFIRNTDTLVEGLQNKWFTNVRAKSAVQTDLNQLAADISAESSARASAISSLESSLDSRLDVLEADPTTKTYVDGEISDLQGQINNVISNIDPAALDSLTEIVAAFQAADSNLNNAITNLSNSAGSDLQDEIDARIAADNALDARLDILETDPTTKTYVDGIQSVLDTRLDILEADPTTKTYVDGEISSEEAARISADNALDARLDVLETDPTTKSYVDTEIADLQGQINAEQSARISAVSSEQSARISADNALDARLDVLETDPTTKSYVDGQVGSEQSARESADNALDARLDVLEGADTVEGSVAKAEKDAKDYADSIVDAEESARIAAVSAEESARIAAVSAEESARISADNALDARLDVLEGADSVEGSVAKAEKDAKDYADSLDSAMDSRVDVLEADPVTKTYVDGEISDLQGQINNVISNIDPAALDSLTEIVASFQSADNSINSAISSLAASASADLDAEEAARIAADNALDARLDVLEGADSVEGSVAKAEKDAKDYADSIVSAEESARIAAVSAEESARISADNALDGRLDILEGDPTTKTYVDGIQSALDARLDVLEADPTTKSYVDGIQSALDARLDILEADPVTKTYVDSELSGKVDVTVNYDIKPGIYSGGSKNSNFQIDWSNGPVQQFTLGASVTVTFANPVVGGTYLLKLVQDGTGSRQITWPGNVEFSNGETPVLSGANQVDFVQMFYDGTTYYADSQLESVTFATSSELSTEEAARIAADNALDARLDVLEADPTTKTYVDGEVASLEAEDLTFFKKDGSRTMTGNMDMGNYGISNVGNITFVSGMKVYRQSKSANYTLLTTDYLIGVTSSTGGVTMTLPSASTVGAGKVFVIKDESGSASATNYIRISPQSGQTIEGQSSFDIDAAYESAMVYSDGSNWFIV